MLGSSRLWHEGQLGARSQRLLKALHVLFAGIWLGALGALGMLLWSADPRPEDAGVLVAAFQLHESLLYAAFVGTLSTGLLFSLFTKWGFFTHDWISAKWALALVLFAVTLAFQSPALSGVAGLADAGLPELHGHSLPAFHQRALNLVGTQLAIVVAVYFISTLKPWGRRRPPRVSRRKLLWGTLLPLGLLSAFGVHNHLVLRGYRAMEVPDRVPGHVPNGVYRGEARCGVPYEVEVSVRNGRFSQLRATRNLDNHYARIAEAVLSRIEREQRTRVDAITGATTTSKCLMAAASDALD